MNRNPVSQSHFARQCRKSRIAWTLIVAILSALWPWHLLMPLAVHAAGGPLDEIMFVSPDTKSTKSVA